MPLFKVNGPQGFQRCLAKIPPPLIASVVGGLAIGTIFFLLGMPMIVCIYMGGAMITTGFLTNGIICLVLNFHTYWVCSRNFIRSVVKYCFFRRPQVLRQGTPKSEVIGDRQQQSDVAALMLLLTGLVLERNIIQHVLSRDTIKASVVFQEIDAMGFHRGECSLVIRLLQRRVGMLTSEVRSQIEALSLERLEALGEALLDFSSAADLDLWLQSHT